jgi:hypothetical protein
MLWILDTGYSILDTRYWMLDTGYSILDTRYWMLDTGYSNPDRTLNEKRFGGY